MQLARGAPHLEELDRVREHDGDAVFIRDAARLERVRETRRALVELRERADVVAADQRRLVGRARHVLVDPNVHEPATYFSASLLADAGAPCSLRSPRWDFH